MTWIECCRKVFIDKIVIPVIYDKYNSNVYKSFCQKKRYERKMSVCLYMHYFNYMYDNTGNDVYI